MLAIDQGGSVRLMAVHDGLCAGGIVHVLEFQALEKFEDVKCLVEVIVHYDCQSAEGITVYSMWLTDVNEIPGIHDIVNQMSTWAHSGMTFSPISP